jgi:hypothetical protein
LAHTEPVCPTLDLETARQHCTTIRQQLSRAGLLADSGPSPVGAGIASQPAATSWRISPCPFLISTEQLHVFRSLGPNLWSFYRALNRLYMGSVKGTQPAWVAAYLDQGKPESLITLSRMKRFREELPAVIRPDMILTQDGMVMTELDSVPGGIGLTAAMSRLYADVRRETSPPYEMVGGYDGMVRGFAAMLQSVQGARQGIMAIVVSDEARDYRPEMAWMASSLREQGLPAYCVEPRDVQFTEEGLRCRTDRGEEPIGLIYRFYELFDLLNIPKSELVQYALKKDRVAVTPPYKPALEEKLAFALLHHPVLRPFWEKELGHDGFVQLSTIMPKTWVLDPAPIPPAATIPGLHLSGRAVANWRELGMATQKERQLVIKPSGFSELAWGSRGVSVGHDLPQNEWAGALDTALASFPTTPYILQEFHKGRQFEMDYHEPGTGTIVRMSGRARLSPYYFVANGTAELAGILATVCPADKKVIHGMKDAVMVPCAVPLV